MGVKAACELFLDSLIYNAHGTAADALWTRVPLVTAPGALQPARVAASMLLHPARALSQLVARTPAEMRALAVSFAVSRAAPKGEQAGARLAPAQQEWARVKLMLAGGVEAEESPGIFGVRQWTREWERGLRMAALDIETRGNLVVAASAAAA